MNAGEKEFNQSMLEPAYRAPIVDALRRVMSRHNTRCGFFESQYFHCLEAFGQKLGRQYCDLERRDLNECASNYKKLKRVQWIKEQYKKWDEKRDGPRPEGAKLGEAAPDQYSQAPTMRSWR